MLSNRMTTVLWFLLGISMTLAAVLGVMVLTDEGGTPGATIAITTSLGATTSTAPGTTTTTAPPTTTTVGTTTPACTGLPSASIPAAGPGVTTVIGDFDADGAMDQLIGYQAGGTQRIQIALSYGYATEVEVFGPAVALAAQAFAEGDAWLGLAQVDFGASTEVIQWFQLNGCTIVKSTINGTGEASFIRGGGVMHGDGIVCNPTGFTANSVQTNDGTNWEYFTTTYEWDPVGRTFLSGGMASSTLTSPADDAVIFTAYALVCPFSP